MTEIPVDLTATRGRLTLPGSGGPEPHPAAGAAQAAPEPGPPPGGDGHAHKVGETCRYCGWVQSVDPFVPDAADAQRFRDAVFGGVPYTKTVVLFGATVVTFQDLSSDVEAAANRATLKRVEAEKMSNRPEIVAALTGFLVGLAVVKIEAGARRHVPDPPDPSADPQARHDALQAWCGSDVVYRAVRSAYTKFRSETDVMMARAHDPSFFGATGSGGGSPVSQPAR